MISAPTALVTPGSDRYHSLTLRCTGGTLTKARYVPKANPYKTIPTRLG
ncbi:hypothetical protein [Nocardia lijiangensis]